MYSILLTTILIGIIGGITPWPILLMATSLFLSEKDHPRKHVLRFVAIVSFSDIFIGSLIFATAHYITFSSTFFSFLSLFGWCMLCYMSYKLLQMPIIDVQSQGMTTSKPILSTHEIILYMFWNGPVRIFWLTVCLPLARQLQAYTPVWYVLFIVVFQVSIIISLLCLMYLLSHARSLVQHPIHMRRTFYILSALLCIIGLGLLYEGVSWFL